MGRPVGTGPTPAAGASETEKLLARIDRNPLPKGYDGNNHQSYVDRIMAGLKPEQRARVGKLWKGKRRLDPDMPNPGASFVRILSHVAEGAGKADSAGRPSGAKTSAGNSSRQKVPPSPSRAGSHRPSNMVRPVGTGPTSDSATATDGGCDP